jgi:predicted AlkP superfamily phosphohydrolase/phosphomutase
VRGIVGWGAHDPGVDRAARPADLDGEFAARFGPYPAEEWTYGFTWPSAERTRRMAEDLAAAVDLRAKAALWLLQERLADWDLALVTVGETHSAIEALWHGIDPSHPLHRLPSAAPARAGVHSVYMAVDRLVGKLAAAFQDAAIVVFATGGMGINRSDLPSMALLPDLLYRRRFGNGRLQPSANGDEGPPLQGAEEHYWKAEVQPRPYHLPQSKLISRIRRLAAGHPSRRTEGRPVRQPLDWMPAAHYRPYWPRMPAFALPSFYDGRIRVNLAGRERRGVVALARYESELDAIEAVLRACVDPATGACVVDSIERYGGDPLALGPTGSDLVVVWRGAAVAFDHPALGRVGPLPFRRTGGHTGPYGMAMVSGQGVAPGAFQPRSSFDVVPTIIDLLGHSLPASLSGSSLLPDRRPSQATSEIT